jgi:twitching motility protein PilT
VDIKELDDILTRAVRSKASDVHLTVGLPVQVRIFGEWQSFGETVMKLADCESTTRSMLGERRFSEFLTRKECDMSHSISHVGRFRVNAFVQRGSMALAIRVLPFEVPSFEQLGLPIKTMRELSETNYGIVLICGATGTGKSTTLAAMISHINRTRKRHIITIEDPIEFLHNHQKSIVDQREVEMDTSDFSIAMRQVLRQSPDVVLVGEIRDRESVQTALMIAETGHLVLSSIHSGEVTQGLSRIIDMFPSDQEREVRVSLSLVMRGMLVQQLLPGLRERPRVLAYELMTVNPAVRSLIREGKFEQVYSQMQMGKDQGMCTMNASLVRLWKAGEISAEVALAKTPNTQELKALMEHAQYGKI